jgi:hypothetical protein
MERTSVDSSNVVSIGYEVNTDTLEVEFSGGIYCYYDVPAYVFEELMASDSKGTYLHQNIKNSYNYEKI